MRSILLLLFCIFARALAEELSAESQEVIDAVNSAHTTWQAGRNFHGSYKKNQVRRLLGLKKREGERVLPIQRYERSLKDIPDEFDARNEWSDCASSIGHIWDQSDCGSCWAVSAASVLTDRMCIASKAKFTAQLSARELMTCCSHCGDGCNGGYDDQAWKYFHHHGIVTGGDYGSHEGCQPYPLKPCEHHVNGSRISCPDMGNPHTPDCFPYCTNRKYKKPFRKDHHKTKESYQVESIVESIQQEILNNGPVQAGFTVYEDFLSYKTGVYQHVTGDMEGGHAVKIIGWGVENGTAYWLVSNSWNTDWGDHGFFKIRRGVDECGFESEISAGIPDLSNI
ncbi:cathepsin B-like isoform X2 [Homalodisca vitripennis]|nr:cathepsin B-like isoform X2 [Homalodisca vitripennis]KAG8301347.1 hypothetical protein J6590_055115 [Homalodisca vitripennis]